MFLLITFSLLWIVGFLCCLSLITRAIYDIAREMYVFYVAPTIGRSVNLKERFGDWALITGATDGIGKGYVLALAAKGLNIVLVSRNEEKLKAVVAEVKERHPNIQLRYIVHNYTKKDDKDIAKFSKELEGVLNNIGILVNNVGIVGDQFAKNFISIQPSPLEAAYEVVQVNVNSLLLMTALLLPRFIQRKRGIIINISSISAVHPNSGMAAYSASKAFMDFFGRSLRQELQKTGILVQTVYPGLVKTNIIPESFKAQMPSWIAPDWEPFTKYAVETIGVLPETYGCLSHRLQSYILLGIKILPPVLGDMLISHMSDVRAAMLEKNGKKKK